MAGKDLTHDDLTTLLGEALTDADLRAKLLSDPAAVIASKGFAPSPAAVDFFKSLHSHGFDAASKKIHVKGKKDPIKLAGDM
jgi:hypothetical protein